MRDAFIVDALRTPVGRRNGSFAGIHAADLGGFAMKALVERTGVPAEAIDDVIFGCANQIGAQAGNPARTCWLSAGLPESVPATTVDRRCGSGQQAIEFAAQGVMAGVHDLVIAGGVENMSQVPIGSPARVGEEHGFGGQFTGEGWRKRYGDVPVSQLRGAETLAERWDLTREALEEFSLESHRRADRAWSEGRFDAEVVPFGGLERDEGIRPDTTLEKMAGLGPVLEGGRITAASSSQISDASSALLVASADACDRHGLEPLVRIHSSAVVGSDPILMLFGPVPATKKVMDRSGLDLDDIDLFEVNEAFAPVPMVWMAEIGVDHGRLNVNGGAIALGHPLGATGARLMTTLVHEMVRTGATYGLQAICEGGGTANATILERV
ncbi:MAG TPA: acetyl-CoA C-acyltransferase [Acidimicrobiia bacterium]|nr:acetyl-CoA C-acyltransferase [Acidimicrobiia bacterium]